MKQKKWIAILLVLFMFCGSVPAFAVVTAPDEIYVGDYANVLSEETEQYIIQQNQALEQASGAQIVIVTVDFLDGMDIEEYAYTIFNEWGIGDAEKDNGLLLLLAIGEENYWAVQGKGLEGILSSGILDEYLYEYLEPDFAAADYDAGVYNVFNAFLSWFNDYYELSAADDYSYGVNEQYDDDSDWLFWLIVLILIIVFISWMKRNKDQERKKNRKNKNNKNKHDDDHYDGWDSDWDVDKKRRSARRNVVVVPGTLGKVGSDNQTRDNDSHTGDDLFGGGATRGGGAGRRTSGSAGRSFGGFGGSSSGGFRGGSRSFGGGSTRGGGAGRRR